MLTSLAIKLKRPIRRPLVHPGEWLAFAVATCLALLLWFSPADRAASTWAMATLTGHWQTVMGLLGWLGQGFVQFMICLGVGWAYHRKGNEALSRAWWAAIPVFIAVGLLAWPVKTIIGRARPKLWHGEGFYGTDMFNLASNMHSFPSGHTVTSFALVAVVTGMYGRKVAILLWGLALLTGLGRIGIGAHWPADVLMGAAFGTLGGLILRRLYGLNKKSPGQGDAEKSVEPA